MYLLRIENKTVIHIQGNSLSLDQPLASEFPHILYLGESLPVILLEAGIPLAGGLINQNILAIIIYQQKFAIFPLEAFRKIKNYLLIDIFWQVHQVKSIQDILI